MGRRQGRMRSARLAFAAIGALLSASAAGDPLRVAVASNFQAAFEAVHADFAAPAIPTYGSSGLLYAQIVQGRPFDLFLSADAERPRKLVAEGRAAEASVYARGILVLLVNDSEAGADWLGAGRRVALANPATAPYGRAAAEVLDALNARPQRIQALNVAQAFHFAASGAVDGAFVALAQVRAKAVAAERYWIVPGRLHAPIEQVAVVMRGARQVQSQAWLDELLGGAAQRRIGEMGYRTGPEAQD